VFNHTLYGKVSLKQMATLKDHDDLIADDTGWREDIPRHHHAKKWCRFIKFRVDHLEPELLDSVKRSLMNSPDYPGSDRIYAIPDFTKTGCWMFLA
jgi:hypothetical protein